VQLKKASGQINNVGDQYLYTIRKKHVYKKIFEKLQTTLEDVSYKEVKSIEYNSPKPEKTTNYRFIRNLAVINWMLKYLWVNSKEGLLKENKTEFFFSDVREIFRFVALEIYAKGTNNKLGYIVLSISKESNITTLKLLDHDLQCQNNDRIILSLVIKYASAVQADRVDITNNVSKHLGSSKIINSSYLRKMERRYLFYMSDMTNEVAIGMKNVEPDYCDGDLPFS
jgi:hypothetical protein